MRSLFAMMTVNGHAWLSCTKHEDHQVEATEIPIIDRNISEFLKDFCADDGWLRCGPPSILFERVFHEKDDLQMESALAFDPAPRHISLQLQYDNQGKLTGVAEYQGKPLEHHDDPRRHRYTLLQNCNEKINVRNVRLMHSLIVRTQYIDFLKWVAENAVSVRMLLSNPV